MHRSINPSPDQLTVYIRFRLSALFLNKTGNWELCSHFISMRTQLQIIRCQPGMKQGHRMNEWPWMKAVQTRTKRSLCSWFKPKPLIRCAPIECQESYPLANTHFLYNLRAFLSTSDLGSFSVLRAMSLHLGFSFSVISVSLRTCISSRYFYSKQVKVIQVKAEKCGDGGRVNLSIYFLQQVKEIEPRPSVDWYQC